jgi:predicted  nucleic acid-binding Zn-ribbon protein
VLQEMEQRLEDTKVQIEEAKKEVQKPFEFEQKLNEFSARQVGIDTELEFSELQKEEDVILDDSDSGEEIDKDRQPEYVNAIEV